MCRENHKEQIQEYEKKYQEQSREKNKEEERKNWVRMWYDCFEASVEKTHGKNIKREKINMKIPFATDRHEIVKDGDTYEVKKG